MTAQAERKAEETQAEKVHKIVACLLAATAVPGYYGGFRLEVTIQNGVINRAEGHIDKEYRLGKEVV